MLSHFLFITTPSRTRTCSSSEKHFSTILYSWIIVQHMNKRLFSNVIIQTAQLTNTNEKGPREDSYFFSIIRFCSSHCKLDIENKIFLEQNTNTCTCYCVSYHSVYNALEHTTSQTCQNQVFFLFSCSTNNRISRNISLRDTRCWWNDARHTVVRGGCHLPQRYVSPLALKGWMYHI